MSPQAKLAHMRLLSSLPSRTHQWQPITREWGYKRAASDEAEFKKRLLKLQALGWTRKEMMAEYGCTSKTIVKHLGRKK